MKKITVVNQYELPIDVSRDGRRYLATCPIWSDCYAQGETVDEAISEIVAVAATLIELYQEEGERIPVKLQKTRAKNRFSLKIPLIVPAI